MTTIKLCISWVLPRFAALFAASKPLSTFFAQKLTMFFPCVIVYIMNTKPSLSTRDLCYIGIFSTIISVCSQIAIPLPGGVPLTLQTWAIALAGLVLGPKNGTMAVIVYILLGAAGAPVFANMTSGLGVFLLPSGGFVLAFPFVALLAGLGERKGGMFWMLSGLLSGMVLTWIIGMFYFSWITKLDLWVSFTVAVIPFILTDLIKIATLPYASKGIKAALVRGGVAL